MADGTAGAYDVAIIGAGVVGTAIARHLSHYRLTVALVESAADVGAGTSKANTAILHTGFDATPGTLEARLVRRGSELLHAHGPGAGIPIEDRGALLVAWTDEELAALGPIAEKARANGVDVLPVPVDELYRREPRLGPGALGALHVPGEAIVCTFTTPLAYATEALRNGVEIMLGRRVVDVARDARGLHQLITAGSAPIVARWVVNAAGLDSDRIDRLFGHERFTIHPRRGQLIVFDKLSGGLVRHILLPVPTKMGKGVLVAPTVFGNVVLGPTAEDIDDRTDTSSTAEGLAGLLAKGARILPDLLAEEVTAVYAGLRAATEHGDYQLFLETEQRYVCVGGIRSTGLTASMAIAEHVSELLRSSGVPLERKERVESVRMANIGEAFPRPYADPALISGDPEYGRVVCHCERVTAGEIRDALRAPIPARDLDGLKRRTRAHMGRCQGFFCGARVRSFLADGGRGSAVAGVSPGPAGAVSRPGLEGPPA